jgi:hypothetical protein
VATGSPTQVCVCLCVRVCVRVCARVCVMFDYILLFVVRLPETDHKEKHLVSQTYLHAPVCGAL